MGQRTNTAVWLPNQQRWQIKVQKDGVRKTFTSSKPGRTGQREANAKADAWLDEGITNTRIFVEKAYIEWIAGIKETTSSSNWLPIESRWKKWVLPLIGKKRVEALTEQQLQVIVNRAYAGGLSKKTLTSLCCDLRNFCKWLRLSRLSTLFPESLHVPKAARSKEKKILQPESLRALFTIDTTLWRGKRVQDPYINAYRFSAVTGLRPGELIGLRWADVHGNQVCIRRAINVHGEETRGKNENALRAFTLTGTAAAILADQRLLTGAEDSVFDIQSESTYRHCWKRYCEANDIDYIPPYNLRHTFVSLAKTLPEGAVKPLVGHSRQMDTYGVYAHLLQGEEEQTALELENKLQKVLCNKPVL